MKAKRNSRDMAKRLSDELRAAYEALNKANRANRMLKRQANGIRRFRLPRGVTLGDAGQTRRRLQVVELQNEQRRQMLEELEEGHREHLLRQERLHAELDDVRRANEREFAELEEFNRNLFQHGRDQINIGNDLREADEELMLIGHDIEEAEIAFDFGDPNLSASSRNDEQ